MKRAVKLKRLPSERRRIQRQGAVFACTSSCCCCCLHSLFALAAVVGASATARPRAPSGSPAKKKPEPAAPVKRRPRDPRTVMKSPELRVLGLYTMYWHAEQAARSGELDAQELKQLVSHLRRAAQACWEELFPGDAEAYQWILERIPLLEKSGVLPYEARAFQRRIEAKAREAHQSGRSFTALGHLWKTHVLYMEIEDAARRGELAEKTAQQLRTNLQEQALVRARTADLERKTAPGPEDAMFSLDVLTAAIELVHAMGKEGILTERAQARLLTRIGCEESEGEVLVSEIPAGADCTICGDPLASAPIVRCASCETPHHAECWKYNQGCATFACGCVDVQSATESPARPLHFDVHDPPNIEGNPAGRAYALYWVYMIPVMLVPLLALGPVAVVGYIVALPVFLMIACAFTTVHILLVWSTGRTQGLAMIGRIAFGVFCASVVGGIFFTPFAGAFR